MPFTFRNAGRSWATAIKTVGAAVAAAQLVQAAPSIAGSFDVNPVNLSLASDKGVTSLTVGNSADTEVAIRITAHRWTQVNGKDVYSPTDEVIASPPIFKLGPQSDQLVRLGLRQRTPGAAYRIIVEEIPTQKVQGTGIKVALRLNLPLYVQGGQQSPPDLRWSTWRDAKGATVLQARNEGGAHSQILSIAAFGADGRQVASTSDMGVVLPGSARRWTLDKAAGIPAEVVVTSSRGELRSKVLVEQH